MQERSQLTGALHFALGIAGLACAIALRRVGHHAIVLERKERANVVSVLDSWTYQRILNILRSPRTVVFGYHPTVRRFYTTGAYEAFSCRGR